jgi:hypothetical protein
VSASSLEDRYLTSLPRSCARQVANIRFNVARELQAVATHCGVSTYETQVLPVLTVLMDDDDRDVRFFAEKAASALDEAFVEDAGES